MGPEPSGTPLSAPRPILHVDGGPLHHGLLGLVVEEQLSAPRRCGLILDASGPEGPPLAGTTAFGKPLAVSVEVPGSDAAPKRLFLGRIMGLGRVRNRDGPPRIEVEAADALQSLDMTRRSRSFPEAPGPGIIQQVAASHGLTAEVGVVSPFPEVIVQADETDLAFLRRLAVQVDCAFRIEASTLRFQPVDAEESEAVTLSGDRDLLEYRVRADLSGQRAEVEVRGWDPGGKAPIAERPDLGTVGPTGSSLGAGSQVLAASWGWGVPTLEPSVLLGPANPLEARGWAGAWFRSLEREFVELRGTVGPGPPWLRPGRSLDLTDVGSTFPGRYRVVACRHHWNSHEGVRTEFRALRWVRPRTEGA